MSYGLSLAQKRRRIPALPDTDDRGAPLPQPTSGYEYANTAGAYEAPVIVAVKKPDYKGA